jgi:outer membrane receptor protein involved in Fe transport
MSEPAVAQAPMSAEQVNEVIIVTAKRSAQPLGTLAGNLARLSTDEIDFIRATHPSEALDRLPGVLIHRGSGLEHLTSIRSPVLVGDDGAGSFLFLEDGVPLRAAGFANVNGLFEAHSELAEAIEVVRGPGSAFYGSNAVHGLVNVISREPSERLEGLLDVAGGSFGRVSGRAFLSGPFGDHRLFAGLTLAHENGFRASSGFDDQKLTLRGDLVRPQVDLRATLSAVNLNQETAGFVEGHDAYKHEVLARANANPEAFRDARALRFASRVEAPLAGGTLAVTPIARWNEMRFLLHFFPSKAIEENGHWSAGALATFMRPFGAGHELALGLDAEYTHGYLRETQRLPTIGTFAQGVHYDYAVQALVIAPYLHTEWRLASALRASAGVRIEHIGYDYDNRTSADTVGRFQRPPDRRDSFLTVTPKFGIVYAPSDRIAIFISAARGARAPQATELYRLQDKQIVGDIEPETLDSIEIGARGTIHSFEFELALFAMEKRNFFFRDADGFNVPDGKTRHRGFEWFLSIPLAAWAELSSSGAYARHVYGFSRPVVSAATETITKGADVDTAPHLVVNTRLVLRPTGATRAELEWEHVSRYFTDAANAHRYPGHELLNLRLSTRFPRGLELYGAVRNLANTDYAERADFAFGTERYFPGESRNYMIGLSLRR